MTSCGFVFDACRMGSHKDCERIHYIRDRAQYCDCVCHKTEFTILLTKDHTRKGIKDDMFKCPVAVAIRELVPNTLIIVSPLGIIRIGKIPFAFIESKTRFKAKETGIPLLYFQRV